MSIKEGKGLSVLLPALLETEAHRLGYPLPRAIASTRELYPPVLIGTMSWKKQSCHSWLLVRCHDIREPVETTFHLGL